MQFVDMTSSLPPSLPPSLPTSFPPYLPTYLPSPPPPHLSLLPSQYTVRLHHQGHLQPGPTEQPIMLPLDEPTWGCPKTA